MPRDSAAIDRMLRSHGLPPLSDGGGVLTVLGSLVQDHEHLRSLLARCEPEHRVEMYNALVPTLGFDAKPLDVYMSESGRRAEARKAPTLAADGSLKDFKSGYLSSDDAIAQNAVNRAVEAGQVQHVLTLMCRKCTKIQEFRGYRKVDAIIAAREAGWTYDEVAGEGREICPECPAARKAD